jgi:transcriptional regulator with XRE-family HTH domain
VSSNQKTFLSRQECAERIGVSVRTLDRWRFSGEGPSYYKIQKAVKYEEQDIDSYLDNQKITTF